jgi:hypothetical protein
MTGSFFSLIVLYCLASFSVGRRKEDEALLSNSEQSVQECDATMLNSSIDGWFQKKFVFRNANNSDEDFTKNKRWLHLINGKPKTV